MKRTLAGIAFAFVLLAAPATTFAASATFFGPIVPAACHCDSQANPTSGGAPLSTAPDFVCVVQVIQNVINFAISISIILFVLYLAYAGFRLITSAGSSEARSEGKTRIMNVVIGLIVLLCAWLLVDFIMKTLYNSGDAAFGPWNSILAGKTDKSDVCIIAKNPAAITSGTLGILTGTTTVSSATTAGGGGGGGSCTPIPDSQLTTVDGFKVTTDTGQRYTAMKAAAAKDGVKLIITSGYRSPDDQLRVWNQNGCSVVSGKAVCSVRTAAIPCSLGGSGSNHTRGTAVDIQLNSGVYAWLTAHAATYGFYNKLSNDLPHWSDTGT